MENLPNISLITIIHDIKSFYILFKYHWETLNYPKDKLEWIIIDDSKSDYSDLIPTHENIIHIKITSDEYLDKIKFKHDHENIIQNFFQKMKILPNGFKRDFAVGLSSHDYIFHIDIDSVYHKDVIHQKLKYLQENNLQCISYKSIVCYDIYQKKLYSSENKDTGYLSTLFYKKDYWKQKGFQWDTIHPIVDSFIINNGSERYINDHDNTIKLLSIHNINQYNPIEFNKSFDIPAIISTIKENNHPIHYLLNDLFHNQKINIIGINSDFINTISNNQWICENISIEKKLKEKFLIQKIKNFKKNFDLCILNYNTPIWKTFGSIQFNCILFESEKNIETMDSILKSKNYLQIHNLYFNKDFLIR